MKMTDIIQKARQAESVEALIALAKENKIELSEEEAKAYFNHLHQNGELADDELTNVAGGQCKNGDKYVVIATTSCEQWKCPDCGGKLYDSIFVTCLHDCTDGKTKPAYCTTCAYCTYEKGLWLCSNTDFWENRKWFL
ncbi:MAG: hypothetical protein IKC63_07155 [Clostridia bacterium]|nr:hypothetical protein [Clostridia bacterium]